MKNISTRSGGFTLVEIMIVGAIIGLLASIAVPNYAQSRETARRNVSISNLQQSEGAIQRWSLNTQKDEGQAVVCRDIQGYLKRSVVCPAGGRSFEESYMITTVDAAPTFQKKPARHKLAP